MSKNNFKEINDWEVLTPSGWSNFKGIKRNKKKIKYDFVFHGNEKSYMLTCSQFHKLKLANNEMEYAKNLKVGDRLFNNIQIKEIAIKEEETDFFDLISVEKNHEYFTNDIVSSNCAHIELIEDVYTAIYPTISASNGKIIALSSPSGKGTWFHKLCMQAQTGENDFILTTLMWDVHPDRDLKWFEEQTRNMSPKEVAQEYQCDWSSSGETVIDPEDIARVIEHTQNPIRKEGLDRNLWIWKDYDPTKAYLITADVARGDGQDYSTFHVFESENFEQVAEYKGKLTPDLFTEILYITALKYGSPILVVENNNIGYMVLSKLIDKEYRNLYFTNKSTGDYIDGISAMSNSNATPGFTTSLKTRPLIISKLEEYIRKGEIIINSLRFGNELETFVYHNGRQEAQKGFNDDLIMAMAIACWVRDSSLVKSQKEVMFQRALLSAIRISSDKIDTLTPEMKLARQIAAISEQSNPLMLPKQNKLKHKWFYKI